MNESLRPLTLGEILDRTLQLYRRNFLLFAGSAAPPSAVIIAMFLAIGAVFGYYARSGPQAITAHGPVIMLLAAGVVLVLLPLELGATVVSQAALMRAGISVNLGRKLRIREAIRGVWPRFWRYVGLMFLQALFVCIIPGVIAVVLLGLVALLAQLAQNSFGTGVVAVVLVVAIFIAAFVAIVALLLTFSLAFPICVAEDKPALAAISRSIQLTKGTRWRMLLMFVLIWLLSLVVSMLAYIPMAIVLIAVTAMAHDGRYVGLILVFAQIADVIINFLVQVLVTPVYALALVLFYFDQRIRTEGYDIEWMMEQAGLTGELMMSAQAASAPTGLAQEYGGVAPGADRPMSGESGMVESQEAGDTGAGIG